MLLVLVLLVAALLLSVLFSPIRYHLSVAFTEEKKSGAAEISWLLHLISVKVSAEVLPVSEKKAAADDSSASDASVNPLSLRSEVQTGVQLRILGIDPFAVHSFFQKRKQKKAENKRARPKKAGRKKKAGRAEADREKKQPGQMEASGSQPMKEARRANRSQQQEASERVTMSRQTEQERQPGHTEKSEQNETAGQAKKTGQGEASGWTAQTGQGEASGWTAQTGQREAAGQTEQNRQGGRAGHTKTFLDKIRAFCERIKQIPEQIRRLAGKGKKLLRKPEQIKRKISRFFKKAEKYEAREVLLDVWEQIKKMLHHFRVRKGSGYFRFGTGDPALTGELTGVLYLLLPTSCGEIQITPQFTDTMLDTELEIRGHIRLIHLVRMAWWAFFNKKLRRLIRAFRK